MSRLSWLLLLDKGSCRTLGKWRGLFRSLEERVRLLSLLGEGIVCRLSLLVEGIRSCGLVASPGSYRSRGDGYHVAGLVPPDELGVRGDQDEAATTGVLANDVIHSVREKRKKRDIPECLISENNSPEILFANNVFTVQIFCDSTNTLHCILFSRNKLGHPCLTNQ